MQRPIQAASPPGPAEIYDARFVPALFAQWGLVLCEAAGVRAGDRVLDVGCGTGALAAAAAATGARVTGLDPNAEMLAVARGKPEAIAWVEGRAESLPFPDAAFDAVASQFALMFVEDRPSALREMLRVLRPGGRLAVAVCDALDRSPGYAAFSALLRRLFGPGIADAFAAPFALGDSEILLRDAAAAELPGPKVARRDGAVRFASVADLVATERACVWTLGGLLDDAQFARLLAEAETALAPFRGADGGVAFTMPALVLTATKPD